MVTRTSKTFVVSSYYLLLQPVFSAAFEANLKFSCPRQLASIERR